MLKEFTVSKVSCGHCVTAIIKEVSGLKGVKKVDVDLCSKRVSLDTHAQFPTEAIVGAINEAGYDEVTVLN